MTAARLADVSLPDLVEVVRARVGALDVGRPARVLVDGPSGSGKTTLALALAEAWPEAQLLQLDAMVPGWHGLGAGSRHLLAHVLRAERPRWRRYDWVRDAPAEWVESLSTGRS